jgi:transcriptional regulator with XRE-family HTH domain
MTDPPDDSPTLRSRALGAELRKIRNGLGQSMEDVEVALERSSGWLSRIENGKRRKPSVHDVTALLDHYGITDTEVREKLLSTTRQARVRGWWNTFKDVIPDAYLNYVGFEAGAKKVYIANPSIVPGLLQTEDYARAVIAGAAPRMPADQVEKRVMVRAKRQELLTRETNQVRLWAVLDEAALLRRVGGPKVMRAQLQYLLEIAERPNVTLQVTPFEAGAHAGVLGPFTILEFPAATEPDVVAIETLVGNLFVEKAEEVEPHVEAFRDLHGDALSEADSLRMIAAAMAEY